VHQGCAVIGLEDGTLLHVEVDVKYRLKIIGEMRGHVSFAIASELFDTAVGMRLNRLSGCGYSRPSE
jgi:hypothetical protein